MEKNNLINKLSIERCKPEFPNSKDYKKQLNSIYSKIPKKWRPETIKKNGAIPEKP
ncbi:hypothetical protein [Cyclobacterium marinum]|uniref:hypothetical protein n=1 Tax=Cyclobacterium marinum TaxID=104 RepID=UPI0016597895|nr:hypothetical protein [Cyclobacterium marinum]MBI0401273.1 hypothetical protein [Cyclobacterium marinum]